MSDDSGTIPFLAEARSGDRGAMGRLACVVWTRLYPFAVRTMMDSNAAEDVLQETLLAMLCRLGTLRDTRRFWPWIYRIAWSKIRDRLRDRRLYSSYEAALLEGRAPPRAMHGSDDSLLDVQIRQETVDEVCNAIDQLSDRHRDILHLRCREDLDYTEIAVLTRTTPARARTEFHRAKQSLKARLACCIGMETSRSE